MRNFPVYFFALVLTLASVVVGCSKLTVIKDETETCAALSTKLVSTFFNKTEGGTLNEATDQNFYVEVATDESQELSAITINNIIYKKDKSFRFSVGNNNFLEVPVWRLNEQSFQIALPVLYVEAKGGITKIEAGKKVYSIRVFKDSGSMSIGDVGVFGDKEGAQATKQVDSAGETVVKHSRESGKTSVGFVLTKDKQPIQKGLVLFTRKLFQENNSISYGVDVSSNAEEKGFTFEFYNYFKEGEIETPKNRTIKYSVASPSVGSLTFELQVTEKIPK